MENQTEYLAICELEQEKLRALLVKLHNESSPMLLPIQQKIRTTKDSLSDLEKQLQSAYDDRDNLRNEQQRIYAEKLAEIQASCKAKIDEIQEKKTQLNTDLADAEKEYCCWNRKYGDTRSIIRKQVELMDELKKQVQSETTI